MHDRIRTYITCQVTGTAHLRFVLVLAFLYGLSMIASAATPAVQGSTVLASVDGHEITLEGYLDLFREAVRQKYYHRKVPERELAEFQRQVLHDVIDQLLLLREAQRLQLVPDREEIRGRLGKYEERYRDQPDWPEQRVNALALMEQRFVNENLLEQLEARTRDLPSPAEFEIREYYDTHAGKFTRPEQVHASVILLRVSPSAPESDWQAARDQARSLVFRIREGGEKFADLAREYSMHHESAAAGGDLGYVHQVMFSDQAQLAVDTLQPGDLAEPVMLLEGVGIFLLHDRIDPIPLSYAVARETALQMVEGERRDAAWRDLRERLRADADIRIHEEHLLPLEREAEPEHSAGGV